MKKSVVLVVFPFLAAKLRAQTFETLHRFGDSSAFLGTGPVGEFAADTNGVLYGVTRQDFGGGLLRGTVFSFDPSYSKIRVLHRFTNSVEGTEPGSGVLLSSNMLYGMTSSGGPVGGGTVFAMIICLIRIFPEGLLTATYFQIILAHH